MSTVQQACISPRVLEHTEEAEQNAQFVAERRHWHVALPLVFGSAFTHDAWCVLFPFDV